MISDIIKAHLPQMSEAERNNMMKATKSAGIEIDEWDVTKPSRGLGDTIAKVTSRIGIKPCKGCKGRQKKLNSLVGYHVKRNGERIEVDLNQNKPRRKRQVLPFSYDGDHVPPFVTTDHLMESSKKLASMLPSDTSLIIGVARSGLCAATMVSMMLHLPLAIIRQSKGDLIEAGSGWRLRGSNHPKGRAVVIDDTCMTGNSFRKIMPVVKKEFPHALRAAIYVNPNSSTKPDIWVNDLPWPHLLEWNLFNSVLSKSVATDFDGIICEDCPPGMDDDGPKYLDFLRNVKPLYLSRKAPIPLIVTARLEKYRPQTIEWLNRHNVRFDQLIMGPWRTKQERARGNVIEYKSKHFRNFLRRHHKIKPPMFIESCKRQAMGIAKNTGGLVVCPAAKRCFK